MNWHEFTWGRHGNLNDPHLRIAHKFVILKQPATFVWAARPQREAQKRHNAWLPAGDRAPTSFAAWVVVCSPPAARICRFNDGFGRWAGPAAQVVCLLDLC